MTTEKPPTTNATPTPAELVVLTTDQIRGLRCAHCALPLVTSGLLGTYCVNDQEGERHLADLFVCAPTCEIAATLHAADATLKGEADE